MLHITNGDFAADLLRRARLPGIILAWRDVLHEGPVPAQLDAAGLRRERAHFLARFGGEAATIERQLEQRDAILESFPLHEEVALWFEHDLYDQLQILQILDRFAHFDRGEVVLSMLCVDQYPGIDRFVGLGQLEPQQLRSLFLRRQPVNDDQLELAEVGWQALRSPDPTWLDRLRHMDLSALPHLAPALLRHLEQFPERRTGLSRSEAAVLAAIDSGATTAADLFRAQEEREERPFLGDTVLWWYLERLAAGPRPALVLETPAAGWKTRVHRTDDGAGYARGELDFVACNGIDRWWGGVHQAGHQARWRWDAATHQLHDAR